MAALQYPKIEAYDGYLYVDPARHRLQRRRRQCFATHDVDFFLGPNYLVTVHDGHSRSIAELREHVPAQPEDPGRRAGRAVPPHRRRDGRSLPAGGREARGRGSTSSRRRSSTRPQPALVRADPGREARRVGAAPHRHAAARRDRAGSRGATSSTSAPRCRSASATSTTTSSASPTTRSIFQDRITGILDAHLSNVSNRLNEVMKVLTVVVDDLHAADAADRASAA